MFNKRQIVDALRKNREDVAESIIEQYIKTAENALAAEEIYSEMSAEQLRNLADNGDDDACAYYVRRRISENTLFAEDLNYLENALANLNFEAALVGIQVYGIKDGRYNDEAKVLFGCVILEQYGDKAAHKRLVKAAKKNADLVRCARTKALTRALHGFTSALKAKMTAFRAEVMRADKAYGYPDGKFAYLVQLFFTEASGRETDGEDAFVFYLCGKKIYEEEKALADLVADIMTKIAEKTGMTGDVYLNERRHFHYGGTGGGLRHGSAADGVHIKSDENLDISIINGGRLKSNVCVHCGGKISSDGVCVVCGRKFEKKEKKGINIFQGKEMEALLCTQCGAGVKIDDGGKTAYCPYCGTTFDVSGSALKNGVLGLNYEDLQADMPADAEIPDIGFVRASIVEDMITAILPKNFIVMSDEVRRVKYPVNPPRYIYTTPDTTVNLNVNVLGELKEEQVFDFGRQMIMILRNARADAVFGETKQFDKNGNILFVDFVTAGLDQPIYNAMFFFSVNDRQGIGSWNCLGKDRWFWKPVFEHAVRTMEFKKTKPNKK